MEKMVNWKRDFCAKTCYIPGNLGHEGSNITLKKRNKEVNSR